jgi:hypothetical protein
MANKAPAKKRCGGATQKCRAQLAPPGSSAACVGCSSACSVSFRPCRSGLLGKVTGGTAAALTADRSSTPRNIPKGRWFVNTTAGDIAPRMADCEGTATTIATPHQRQVTTKALFDHMSPQGITMLPRLGRCQGRLARLTICATSVNRYRGRETPSRVSADANRPMLYHSVTLYASGIMPALRQMLISDCFGDTTLETSKCVPKHLCVICMKLLAHSIQAEMSASKRSVLLLDSAWWAICSCRRV